MLLDVFGLSAVSWLAIIVLIFVVLIIARRF